MNKQPVRQRIEGPPMIRSMSFRAEGVLSEEERRIRVSFSSETPVLRTSWWDDPWIETLGHADEEVNLDRLNAGAPSLYNHNRWDRENRIGVVERAWLEDGRGQAEIRFSKREDVAGIWQDIRDGVLCNVSVGYQIHERTLVQSHDDGPDEYRVTAWTPMELSMVDVPADHTVGVGRSQDQPAPEQYRIFDLPDISGQTARGNTMVKETEGQAPATPETRQTPDNPPVNLDEVRATAVREALEAERVRRTEIRALCDPLRDRHEFVAEIEARALDAGLNADQVGRDLLRKMGEHAQPLAGDPANPPATAGEDQRDKIMRGVSDALLVRAAVRTEGETRISLDGNPWRGASLLDLARDSLSRCGVEARGMDKREIVARAFTQSTSDFPVLLENVMHKALLVGYRLAPDTWARFCAVGSVSDFRDHNRYMVGSLGNLDDLTELSEFKNKPMPDGRKERVSIATKGNLINISRQTVINDDLGAFVGLAQALGRAGRRTIEATAYSTLVLNSGLGPLLNDGKTLFHADHGNIVASGGAPSVAEVEKCALAMAAQMDISGNDYLDLSPSIWLGPKSLEVTARVLNASTNDPDAPAKSRNDNTPNPYQNYFSDLVATSRLSGAPWYLFANPSEAPVLEVSFLDGEQEPFLDMEDGFDVDGARWKARLDFGVSAVGYEGAVRNAGA